MNPISAARLDCGYSTRPTSFNSSAYLFNLEEWAERDQLRSDTGVDRQIVKSPVAWHSDHVQLANAMCRCSRSRRTRSVPALSVLRLADARLRQRSVLDMAREVHAAARSEIDAQEKFISFFKVGVLTRVMSGRDTASLETGAGAKAANINVDDLSEVIRALDKKAQGEFSLRLLLAARSAGQLRDTVPAVHRIFVDARAQVMEETLGNLSGFYAMFPGNHKFNVFPLWLSEEHHARLSSVFAPHHRPSPLGRPRRRIPEYLGDAHADTVLSGRVCGWGQGHAHHRPYRIGQIAYTVTPRLRWSRNTADLLTFSTSAVSTRA